MLFFALAKGKFHPTYWEWFEILKQFFMFRRKKFFITRIF